MCEATKDVFQVIAWCVASIGGVVSAFLAVYQMVLNRRQREEEQRWKEALQAKTLLDEVFKSPNSSSALRMLDWSGRKYKNEDGEIFVITEDEFQAHLKTADLKFGAKDVYVRDCFDDLFSRLDMIEHFIKINLIRFDDVRVPFEYYVQRIEQNHWIFCGFISYFGYKGTFDFLSRFPVWSDIPGCNIKFATEA